MGLIISTIAFVISIPKIVKYVLQTNRHNLFEFVTNLISIKWKQWHTKKRFKLQDFTCTDSCEKMSLLPFKHDYELELPSKRLEENYTIYGVNSNGQALLIDLKWEPVESKASVVSVKLVFNDGNDFYELIESTYTPLHSSKYSVGGLNVEIISPLRCIRLQFRGYLKNQIGETCFVKFRLLWQTSSEVFDYRLDFDDVFMGNELCSQRNSQNVDKGLMKQLSVGKIIDFENRFEQYGQIKGTVQIENEAEKEIYLWGSRRKHFSSEDSDLVSRTLYGYSKKGFGFSINFVSQQVNNNKIMIYRNGTMFWCMPNPKPIIAIDGLDNLTMIPTSLSFTLKSCQKEFQVEILVKDTNSPFLNLKLNGHQGQAIIIESSNNFKLLNIEQVYLPVEELSSALVVNFEDRVAANVNISGGKGSSLAILSRLSNQVHNQIITADLQSSKHLKSFIVPHGVVVTANAYSMFVESSSILKEKIEAVQNSINQSTLLEEECRELKTEMLETNLPAEIQLEIRKKLISLFGNEDLALTRFAVRSSASGEDSEEMSAAGQMTTFLGVKGFDDILTSVIKCWTSQFDPTAVEYKRGYGQPINSPMAVVIQEMVNCDSAGVLFTCDPISGDEREILISGNFGLGESVVAATVEPDTIRLTVDVNTKQRVIKKVKSIQLGSKAFALKLADSGVTTNAINSNNCCLTNKEAIELGNVALQIARYFGFARDIEWGLKDGRIYILQSRPITNLDHNFNDFESKHDMDYGLPAEVDYISRANVGEVMPECFSPLQISVNLRLLAATATQRMHDVEGVPWSELSPMNLGLLIAYCQQVFIELKNSGTLDFTKGNHNNPFLQSIMFAIFGQPLDDEELLKDCDECQEPSTIRKLRQVCGNILPIISGWKPIEKQKEKLYANRPVQREDFSGEDRFDKLFNTMCKQAGILFSTSKLHINITQLSAMCNVFLMGILSISGLKKEIMADVGILLSNASNVISADVPASLKKLAKSIKNPKQLLDLTVEEMLKHLTNENNEESKSFKEFIEIHGHRGYKEFDALAKSWREDPLPVIESLRTTLSCDLNDALKSNESFDDTVKRLQTPLNWIQKSLLKLILPLCKRSVAMRENSKSLLILSVDQFRQQCRLMADLLHENGRLPDKELLYYLRFEEIPLLIKTRNPLLIMRAKQRRKAAKEMNNWKFRSFQKGHKFEPFNITRTEINISAATEKIRGIPVSSGLIKAKVCVAPNLKDASKLKNGYILITYSTDIGWSPYFPVISGLVTEIGGMVSHGAVIAREYGIPCLVGVENACRIFKTGDTVFIDCQSGYITKIVDDEKCENGNQSKEEIGKS